jgi:hypothetical protein
VLGRDPPGVRDVNKAQDLVAAAFADRTHPRGKSAAMMVRCGCPPGWVAGDGGAGADE